MTPTALLASLDGPYKGKEHDSGMLSDSGLLESLSNRSFSPVGQPLCIYGDPAHLLQIYLQGKFRKTAAVLSPDQEGYNRPKMK